jgi:general secretion pathway protein C
MDRRHQKKAGVGLALVALPLLAFLNADGVAEVVRAHLPAGPLLAPASRASRPRPAAFHSTNAASILARNPFDSVTGPIGDGAAPPPPGDEALAAPSCEGFRVSAIAASEDPAWSIAALHAGDHAILQRQGGEVGSKRVAYVGWDRVWLEDERGLCQVALFAPATEEPAKKGPPPAEKTPDKRVHKKSATEVEVDRSFVEQILTDPTAIMKSTRMALDQKDGKPLGMRLLGVTPDSVLGMLGLEDGDRLEGINGYDVTRPEVALEAYARLREASHLDVRLNRRGKEVSLSIDVK